jgi:uncharacterized membrane protein
MTLLIAGLLLFFAPHCVSIFSEKWRDEIVAKIGLVPWRGLYSVASLAGFAFICIGYGIARQDPIVLYTTPAWMRHVVMLLMVVVFPLFLAANLPGKIKAKAKHPLLAATKIWAFAHLLVNGTLADGLLFGSFLAWAVLDRISMKKRIQRPIAGAPATKYNDFVAVLGGLMIYAVFVMWGHRALIGVPVF